MRLELEPRATTFPLAGVDSIDAFANSSWNLDSLLKKGIAAAQSGERDIARKLLSQAVAIDPHSEDAWMWLASISDYPEELLAFLNRVLDINPDNEKASDWRQQTNALLAKTFVQKALAARNDGTYALAVQYLDTALTYDEEYEAAWFWKASLAETEEEKLAHLERVLSINPDSNEAAEAIASIHANRIASQLSSAEQFAASGNFSEASRLAQEFADHDDAAIRERSLMILASVAESDEGKLAQYSRVLEVNPANSTAADAVASLEKARMQSLFNEAKTAAAEGDRTHAIEVLEDLLEGSPDFVDGWLLISHLRSSLDEKIAALEKALEIDPENAAARSGLAFLALTFGTEEKSDAPNGSQSQVQSSEEFNQADPHETDEPNMMTEAAEVDEEQEVSSSAEDLAVPVSADDNEDGEMSEPRSVEQLFGPVTEPADPACETVERPSPFANKVLEYDADSPNAEDCQAAAPSADEAFADYDPDMDPASAELAECPFCFHGNEQQALKCVSCRAMLTLSDMERLLAGTAADRETLQNAVTTMEAQWNTREFDEKELTVLGLGYLNLGNVESGFRYLQEASRLDPNNVILAGQVNTLAIRLDEMRRQSEVFDAMPKGKTILVVDDSPTVRKLIAGKLEKSGHNVVCAVDGVDALAKMEEGVPDLVLLDITMPRMDGYEVCKQIRSNPACKNLPVVMISGKDGFFDKVRGRMAGTTGYVTKPFGPETLMKALEMYLIPDEASEN